MAKKNIIDIEEAVLDFQSSDFDAFAMENGYQIRITIAREHLYEWYFTTGSLVVNKGGVMKRIEGQFLTPESVMNLIGERENLFSTVEVDQKGDCQCGACESHL